MTFKVHWEKAARCPPSMSHIERMVKMACPDGYLANTQLLADGCANLNIKIHLQGDNRPLLLRIYQRDNTAASREQALGVLLKDTVPAPRTFYKDVYDAHSFALMEFMPGTPLRDVLLNHQIENMESLMKEGGRRLVQIASHSFPKSGFFDGDLNVVTPLEKPVDYIEACLQKLKVLDALPHDLISRIRDLVRTNEGCFPPPEQAQLVHGDFDPAHILVDKIKGRWKVTAILDWEFTFAGSVWWDVANMLRYSHQMPLAFETSFRQGLQQGGIVFPTHWRKTVDLLNLLCLLDLLAKSDKKNRSRQYKDLCDLVKNLVSKF